MPPCLFANRGIPQSSGGAGCSRAARAGASFYFACGNAARPSTALLSSEYSVCSEDLYLEERFPVLPVLPPYPNPNRRPPFLCSLPPASVPSVWGNPQRHATVFLSLPKGVVVDEKKSNKGGRRRTSEISFIYLVIWSILCLALLFPLFFMDLARRYGSCRRAARVIL